MFTLCTVGCGNIAVGEHGPSIKRYCALNKNVVFAACCDLDKEKAAAFAKQFGAARFYTNMDEMLDAEKPDAVSLIAPVQLTADLACRILDKGYPVMTEKPPGLNAAENKQMTETAGDIPTFVAFNRRFMPAVQKAMKIITDMGEAGRITHIHYRMLRINRRDAAFATTAIHGIDLVKYIAGSDYKNLRFTYHNLPALGETVANFHIQGTTENGTVVGLDFLPDAGTITERLEITTHGGVIYVNLPIWAESPDGLGSVVCYQNGKITAELTGEAPEDGCGERFVLSGFYHENAAFFDALQKKDAAVLQKNNIASGLQSVEVAACLTERKLTYHK